MQSTPLFQRTQYENLRRALLVTAFLCLLAGVFLWQYGKIGSFLLINGHHHPALDVLFQYATHLGDGLIYVPLVLYCLFFNRNMLIPAVLNILICTLLTHFLKRVIFADVLRPISLEAQQVVIHKVAGVYINQFNSFPSGHTSTAFGTALLLVMVLRKPVWAFVVPLLAAVVAYSRVYLAQHFVSDILGGMVIGMITAVLSVWLHPIIIRSLPPSWQNKMGKPVVS